MLVAQPQHQALGQLGGCGAFVERHHGQADAKAVLQGHDQFNAHQRVQAHVVDGPGGFDLVG
ncbi:hypothetical protein D3C87_1670220 [compost metagenome]